MNNITALIGVGSILLIIALICLSILIIVLLYVRYVYINSDCIYHIVDLNKKYIFKEIEHIQYKNSYDNENIFSDLSPLDYLIYQLQFNKKKVLSILDDVNYNRNNYQLYLKEYEDLILKTSNDKVIFSLIEKMIIKKIKKVIDLELNITVKLTLTNINKKYKYSKTDTFTSKKIKNLIERLNYKKSYFYLDKEIWKSICKVERGKVTNRMRFVIYKKDNYRCKRCGRKTKDLEIDHIIPIAKGGKSTMDNLQTLCSSCNKIKGTNIIKY